MKISIPLSPFIPDVIVSYAKGNNKFSSYWLAQQNHITSVDWLDRIAYSVQWISILTSISTKPLFYTSKTISGYFKGTCNWNFRFWMSVASHLCDAQAHVIIKLKWNKIIAKQMESGEVNLAIHFVEFELKCVWKSSIV